jgi:hypothetical protein
VKTDKNQQLKVGVVIAVAAAFATLAACGKSQPPANKSVQPSTPAQPTQPSTPGMTPVESAIIEKTSPFNHNTKAHKQDCVNCHQRTDNEPVPLFPGHTACIDCHQKDFTTTTSQMCIVCHKTPLEQQPKLIAFPTRLVQFGIRGFSHRTHMDAAKMPQGSQIPRCDSCHKTVQGGLQVGFPRHPECYGCHSHQAGEKLAECTTCHAGVSEAMKYRTGSSGAFSQYNFKHASHVAKAACARCHGTTAVAASSPTRPDILKISTARGQRHKSACWSCHVQAREPVCTKCHIGGVPFGG